MNTPIIREIQPKDNKQLAIVIRSVLEDFGVPKVGTAYADASTDKMFEAYNQPKAIYFVIDAAGKIIGGGGVAKLAAHNGNVCELQKMYFLEEARGRGFGKQILEKCLQKAKEFGFEKCYLETMPYMKAAQQLYKKSGFKYIDASMGNTGHFSCPVWMLKDV